MNISGRQSAAVGMTTPRVDEDDDHDDGPAILRPLLRTYQSVVPVWNLPGVPNFNFAFSLFSAVVLSMIRKLIWDLLLLLGWPSQSKMTTDSASSLASVVHSVVLVFFLGVCLFRLPGGVRAYVPSARAEESFPVWWRDSASALLEICTGYMMFDSFFLVSDTTRRLGMELSEFDALVLAHHALTSFYMISSRAVGAGQLSAMILMFTGEITNPLMNGMFVTRFAIQLDCCGRSSDLVLWWHTMLEHGFAVSYVVVRVFVGPLCSLHLTYDLLLTRRGRRNVPVWLSWIWVIMVWTVIYGSAPFVGECVDMIRDGWALKYGRDHDFGERFAIRPPRDEL